MTTTSSILLLTVLTSLRLEVARFQAPHVQLQLPGVPQAEGLVGPTGRSEELTTRKAVESDTMKLAPARVEEVQLSRSFVATAQGLRALEPIDAFRVPDVPAQIPAFKACVRIASPDKAPVRVRVQIKLPNGREIFSEGKNVSFDKERLDVMFDLGNLRVDQAGTYKVAVSLDGAGVAEVPFEVREG